MAEKQQSTSTQQFVEIDAIHDGVIVLKSGGLRRVLMVSGINFDLKTEEEQAMIIGSYQSFLNTLDFTLQFFVHSRKLNTEEYLGFLKERREKEDNALLRTQIDEYAEFIRSFVEMNAIMEKAFSSSSLRFHQRRGHSRRPADSRFLKFWKTKSMEVEKSRQRRFGKQNPADRPANGAGGRRFAPDRPARRSPERRGND